MQVVTCEIHLAGDRNHVVVKTGVTVAEIEILRVIHGNDAVLNIQPTKQDTRKHAEELDRLRRVYKRRMPGSDSKGTKNIVDVVYPGPRPNLPATLKDIGVEYPTEAAQARTKKKAITKELEEEEQAKAELQE
jgi:hypothetical protein